MPKRNPPWRRFQRKLDIGDLLRGTLRISGQAPGTFIGVGCPQLVFSLPSIVERSFGIHPGGGMTSSRVILFIAQFIVQTVLQGASISSAGRLLAGAPVTMREAISVGFRRFPPYFGASIPIVLFILLGLVFLIVPGFVAICALALVGPACIIENHGAIQSIKRSVFLTNGNRWRISSSFLIGLVPAIGIFVVVTLLALLLSLPHLRLLGTLLFLPIAPLIGAIFMIMTTMMFFDLRETKQGAGPRGAVGPAFE